MVQFSVYLHTNEPLQWSYLYIKNLTSHVLQ